MPRLAATDHPDRADDRRVIEDLNRHYLRAAEHADVAWYEEHLSDDFVCITVDGALSDRAAFLKRISQPYPGGHFEALDVRVRFVGELALVHAGFKYTRPDGQAGSGRYTDIYTQRRGRWLCVSAHFNRF